MNNVLSFTLATMDRSEKLYINDDNWVLRDAQSSAEKFQVLLETTTNDLKEDRNNVLGMLRCMRSQREESIEVWPDMLSLNTADYERAMTHLTHPENIFLWPRPVSNREFIKRMERFSLGIEENVMAESVRWDHIRLREYVDAQTKDKKKVKVTMVEIPVGVELSEIGDMVKNGDLGGMSWQTSMAQS